MSVISLTGAINIIEILKKMPKKSSNVMFFASPGRRAVAFSGQGKTLLCMSPGKPT